MPKIDKYEITILDGVPTKAVNIYHEFDIHARITNTGDLGWRNRALDFIRDKALQPIANPVKLLNLKPGESQSITIHIDTRGGEGKFDLKIRMKHSNTGKPCFENKPILEIPIHVKFTPQET